MALSLAACGSSDSTSDAVSYTQAQMDAAKAAATTAAEAAAATAATAAAAAATTAQTAAVNAVDKSTDDAAAISLALRDAAAELGVTGTSTMTDSELVTAIKTVNDTVIASAVDKSTDDAAAITAAVTALGYSGVTTLAQLNTAYDALLNPAAVDTTKTLTSATDNFTTTNGNDTFFALTDGNFATGDILNGGTGNDSLTAVFATAGASEALRPVMTGIETVDIDVTDGSSTATTTTLNLDQSTDVTSIRIGNNAFDTNADTVAVTSVGTAASLTVYDTAGHGSANANNYTMTYSGVTGTSDSATVNVEMSSADGALGTITIANVENVTANASGGYDATYALTTADATTLTITAAADAATDATGGTVTATSVLATTLNVTSATDITIDDATNSLIKVSDVNIDSTVLDEVVTVTSLTTTATASTADAVTIDVTGVGDASVGVDTNFGTYNATTNADTVTVTGTGTGDVTVTMNNTAANIVTTGSGNDTLVIGAGQVLNTVDNINLGGGTGDTIAATASYSSNAAIDLFHDDSVTTTDPTISGAEIARITLADSGAASTVATTSASFASTIELMGNLDNAGSTINNIGASQTVKLGSTLDMTDASSSLTLVQQGATASAAATSLTITSDLLETSTDANIDDLRANVVTSVSLDLSSTDTDVVTATVDGASFDLATSVTVTSAENVTFGGIDAKDDATLDFTGVTGTLSVTVDTTNNYTVKGSATGVNTIIMSTGLDNDDVITGGSATTDSLTATINGLTATTGDLSIAGVETVSLDTATAASTVDATLITGATTIDFSSDQDVTLTGLASGTAIQFGGTGGDYNQTLALTMADATGSSDTLTVKLAESTTDDELTADLDVSGVETITIDNTEATGTNGDKQLALDGADATSLVITGGKSAEVLNLTAGGGGTSKTLNAATSSVDASAFDGVLTLTAATNTATTVTMKTNAGTVTGGAGADTFTVGSVDNYVTGDVGTMNMAAGTDTLNVYVKDSADLDSVTLAETINLYMDASDADGFNVAGGGGSDGIITATTVNLHGGLSGQTYSLTATLTDVANKVIDASNLVGSMTLTYGDDALVVTNTSDPLTITGGQSSADIVSASMSGTNTGTFTMSGVETLNIGNDGTASTVNLANVSGLTKLVLGDDAGTGAGVTVSNYTSGVSIELGDTAAATKEFNGMTATITHASTAGSSDVVNVVLRDTAGTGTADGITVNNVETVNLTVGTGTEDHKLDVNGTNTNASTINVTGTDTDTTLELSTVGAGFTTIDANSFASDFTVGAAARGATAMTITSGTGNDSIAMENQSDVLNAGTKTSDTDNLVINFSGTGGSAVIDLSATDQVTLFNGVANSTSQSNFESVNADAYTQTGSSGVDITGSSVVNTLVGSDYADTIRGGGGADVITGGDGNDNLTGGAAADTFTFAATPTLNDVDTITDFVNGTDKLDISALDANWSSTLVVATLAANGTSLTSLQGTATAADVDVLVLLDTVGFAAIANAEDEYTASASAITDSDGLIVVYFDSATSTVKVAYDADEAADSSGGVTVIAELSSLGSADLDDFVAGDFFHA
jgi:hypothetical protein